MPDLTNINKVFITGDIHQSIDINRLSFKNWPQGRELNKQDILIILGDVGLVWDESREEQYWQEWLNEKPWTTFCVLGNHENYDLIKNYSLVEKFGGQVRQIQPSIFYAETGNLFNLNGINAFVVNGAKSTDKMLRISGKTWWEEELPNAGTQSKIIDNFLACSENIDVLLSHQAPSHFILNQLCFGSEGCDCVSDLLQNFQRITNVPCLFGHHHKNTELIENCACVFDNILDLKKILEKGI